MTCWHGSFNLNILSLIFSLTIISAGCATNSRKIEETSALQNQASSQVVVVELKNMKTM